MPPKHVITGAQKKVFFSQKSFFMAEPRRLWFIVMNQFKSLETFFQNAFRNSNLEVF